MNIRLPFIAAALFAFNMSAAQANNASCPFGDVSLHFSKDTVNTIYMASHTEARLLDELKLSGKLKGRTVQSVGIDPSTCRTIASISIKRNPEVVGFWSLLPDGTQQGKFVSSSEFGHPQDLTVEHDGSSNPYLWLPDTAGFGAKRFKLAPDDEGRLAITDIQSIKAIDKANASLTISISADRQYFGVLGRMSKKFPGKVAVKIYRLQDAIQLGDLTKISPVSEFPLISDQQKPQEFRQGLAIIGNTVFVLTGKPEIDQPNRLTSYTIKGSPLQNEILRFGLDLSAQDGEGLINEAEGLEVVSIGGKLSLIVGIASGDKDNKINRLYKLPLYSSGNLPKPSTPTKMPDMIRKLMPPSQTRL